MQAFTSDRERRLWGWTLAVIIAIYSTLGLTGRLAAVLRDTGLVEASFMFGMFLVFATVAVQWFRTPPSRGELTVWLGVTAAYWMVFTRMNIPEERTHLIEYGVVSVFIHAALLERMGNGGRIRMPAVAAIVATSILGALDECIQALLPNRVFDTEDILFNALAALMAVSATVAVTWVRDRRS